MADLLSEMITELDSVIDGEINFTPRQFKNPNHKWLIRSAFQKYIRRGRADDALRCAEFLYGFDVSYAWSSLQIVAVEDIGLGDPDLLTYTTFTGMKTVHQKVSDPRKLFASLIVRACNAQKTRSCCELSLGTECGFPDRIAMAFKSPTEVLQEDLFVGDELMDAYAAAFALRKRSQTDRESAFIGTMEMMAQEATTPAIARAAMSTFERYTDTMNMAVFPTARRLHGTSSNPEFRPYSVSDDLLPPECEIMNVTSAAFDMHTSTGKKALKAFCTSLAKRNDVMKEFVARSTDQVKGLGSLVFIVEGGQESKRMWSPELAALKEFQDRNFALAYGVPEDLYDPMLQLLWAEFPILNQKREWAAAV